VSHILVIDADALVRDTVRMALQFAGHEAVLAPNGDEGVEEFRSGRFDLVICDIFMTGQSGLQTISEIRGLSATAPIIAMTGGFAEAPEKRFSSDLLQIARHNGVTLTLSKPFRYEQLNALIARCLG
jgi:DNA-binding response OmpR family regulator